MKKVLVLLSVLVLYSVWAGPMGKFDPDAKNWNVKGDCYSCTFFQGCMYPVWFKSPKGAEFPFFVMNDYFTVGTKTYKMIEERWAKFEVKENSEDRFVIVCKGWFCHGLAPVNKPYKDVNVSYKYTLERRSPVMKIDIQITKNKNEDIKFNLIRPRWRFLPFDKLKCFNNEIIDLKKRFTKPDFFTCEGAELASPALTLVFPRGKKKVIWENRENGFLTVADLDAAIISTAAQKQIQYSTYFTWNPGVR